MPTKLGASVTHEVKISHYHRPLMIPQNRHIKSMYIRYVRFPRQIPLLTLMIIRLEVGKTENKNKSIINTNISCTIKFKVQYLSTPWCINIKYFLL